jgi:hypothetical protein
LRAGPFFLYHELRAKLAIEGKDADAIASEVAMAYALGNLPKREGVAFAYMLSSRSLQPKTKRLKEAVSESRGSGRIVGYSLIKQAFVGPSRLGQSRRHQAHGGLLPKSASMR